MKQFDLSGSMPAQQQCSLVRWYRVSLVAFSVTCGVLVFATACTLVKRHHIKKQRTHVLRLKDRRDEIKKKVLGAEREQAALQKDAARREMTKKNRIGDYLMCVRRAIPGNVRLEKISYEARKNIELSGMAKSADELTQFLKGLKAGPCFKNSTLSVIKKQLLAAPSRFEFTITTNL